VDVASFVIACTALALSLIGLGWQIFTWRRGRRFDIRVRIDAPMHAVGSGIYEVVVVIENHGEREEAVDSVALLYSEPEQRDGMPGPGDLWAGPGSSLWDRHARGELPPRRNLRFTYDLLAGRFTPFPAEVVAVASLETGEVVRSAPYTTSLQSLSLVMAGRERPKAADDEDALRAAVEAPDSLPTLDASDGAP
jgi:hypothetical protein